MRLVLRLAARGRGRTSPNPMVGAVVVKDDRIVGRGFHRGPGKAHAEVVALRRAGAEARGATLYLNLEPCCIQGRTPPCTEEIIRCGLSKVVCAHIDPNPRISGGGLARLRDQGITVVHGILEAQARELNEVYIKHITTGQPFVMLKIAQTLDGKIATRDGDSRWVTSQESRRFAHRMRSQVDAVLVGVNTVLRDDPLLTVRHIKGSNPAKIILDSHLRTPLEAKVLRGGGAILATQERADSPRAQAYRSLGVEIWQLPPDAHGRVDLAQLLQRAGQQELTSVLIEGGQQVFTSALRAGVVDKVLIFIAMSLLGEGRDAIGELGIRRMIDVLSVREVRLRRMGGDLLVVGRL